MQCCSYIKNLTIFFFCCFRLTGYYMWSFEIWRCLPAAESHLSWHVTVTAELGLHASSVWNCWLSVNLFDAHLYGNWLKYWLHARELSALQQKKNNLGLPGLPSLLQNSLFVWNCNFLMLCHRNWLIVIL